MTDSAADSAGRSAGVREQDRFLPIANISRIMKRGLPENAKIAKEAKETVQECVSEFISFITSEYVIPFKSTAKPKELRASDKCQREKRKTINGDDLLWALTTLGFEEYVDPLKLFLHKYRESETASSQRSSEAKREIKQEPSQSYVDGMGLDPDLNSAMSDFYSSANYGDYTRRQ